MTAMSLPLAIQQHSGIDQPELCEALVHCIIIIYTRAAVVTNMGR
jgi:hypothetical protein